MKLGQPASSRQWAWSTTAVTSVVLVLAGLSLGVPEQVGCGGGPVPQAPGTEGSARAGDGSTLTGAVDGDAALRTAPLKIVLIWDIPGQHGAAIKQGEARASGAAFSLAVPGPFPEAALADGAVAVAHLIAVPESFALADGPLSDDDAERLSQGALGASGATAVVYKAGESEKYGWLAAFPPGLSCAQGQAPAAGSRAADAPAGFSRVACKNLKLALGALDAAPFTQWALPAAELRAPAVQPVARTP